MTSYYRTHLMDRMITREEPAVGAGSLSLRYRNVATGNPANGEYRRVSDTELQLGNVDSDGVGIPLATVVDGVVVSGNAFTDYSYEDFVDQFVGSEVASFVRHAIGYWILTLAAGSAFTEYDGEISITLTSSGSAIISRTYWAHRIDTPVDSDLLQDDEKSLVLTTSTFVVHFDDIWQEADYFNDDLGRRQRILGVSEIGRRKYQQLRVENQGDSTQKRIL